MFKVGDKVRALNSSGYHEGSYQINEIYTVREVFSDQIRTINSKNQTNGWGSKNFELVQEETPAAQAKDVGTRHNSGKLRWRNVPMFFLKPVAEVGAMAEKRDDNPVGKYETFNYLKGLEINATLDSLKRHLEKFESPYESDIDSETKLSHLAHIAWNALAALHTLNTRPELDDRYRLPEDLKELAEELQRRGR